jgi:hypothetical protein
MPTLAPRTPSHALALGRTTAAALGALALIFALAASPVAAQGRDTTAAPRGGLRGQVVDAASGEPVPDAAVVLLPRPEGVVTSARPGVPTTVAAGLRVRSDAAGRYRFDALAPGAYRLYVSRIGYAPATVDVTLAESAPPDLGVGLTVAPVTLHAVRVEARAPESAPLSLTSGDARLDAARLRQETYLATDVRELTPADVGEAVTLAESDVFRALHRLPGVSTRDEWSAELWTRGARADQTRVYYDGLPLFSPLHAFGLLGGVPPEAVGSAFFHPGVRPASIAEGGAGVLDLRSRPGGSAGRSLSGRGELALTSARLALDGAAGPLGWSVGARRSYLDLVSRAIGIDRRSDGAPPFPYYFDDAFARVDYSFGGGRTLSASALALDDRTFDGFQGLAGSNRSHWGDRLARVGFATPLGVRFRFAQSVGVSTHDFHVVPRGVVLLDPTDTLGLLPLLPGNDDATRVRVRYAMLGGELSPAAPADSRAGSAAPPWVLGYQATVQRAAYAGPGAPYFTNGTFAGVAGRTAIDGRVFVGSLWGERRWRPLPGVTLESGVRLEASRAAHAMVALRPAPRLAARWRLGAATDLSAAYGRSTQYTQAVPRVGYRDEIRFYPGALWLAPGKRYEPPLVTDMATVGAERWLGSGWLTAANAYARHSSGVVTADPTPGLLLDRPLRSAVGDARGFELSARRLTGRTTMSIAYSYGVSTLRAAGMRYPAPEDRTHAFDFTLARQLSRAWRLSSAFAAARGAPYTKATYIWMNDSTFGYELDAPGAKRRPPALGLDVGLDWTHRFGSGRRLEAYAQLHSPLTSRSTGSYRGDGYCTPVFPGDTDLRCESYAPDERREDTVPILPVVGLRVAF